MEKEMSEEWSCVMEPAEEIDLKSQTLYFDFETGEVIGERLSIPCPAIITREIKSPMMHIGDDDFGSTYHHQLWRMQIGEK
jgi:hypothetical protein